MGTPAMRDWLKKHIALAESERSFDPKTGEARSRQTPAMPDRLKNNIALAESERSFDPKTGEARSRQTPAMRDWLKNNNPETKFRAESIKRRLKTTNPRYHAKFGLLQCQCNGTFKVCKKSNKGEDTY